MSLFLSTHVNRIDKKGRVSVPSTFRALLVQESYNGVIAFRSYRHACVDAFGMSRMERLMSGVEAFDVFSQEQDDITATVFADTQQLPFDGDGRIVLPLALRTHAALDEVAAFVGRGATFQIWNPAAFESYQMAARQRLQERQVTIKLQGAGN